MEKPDQKQVGALDATATETPLLHPGEGEACGICHTGRETSQLAIVQHIARLERLALGR